MRAGRYEKAGHGVGKGLVRLPRDGIAKMDSRDWTSSRVCGSFELRRCGEAIEIFCWATQFSDSVDLAL